MAAMARISSISRILTASMLALAMCGCSEAAPGEELPYAAEIDQARARATDPEIKAALEDGLISDEELERSKQIALACLAERGRPASYDSTGSLRISPPEGVSEAELMEVVEECTSNTFDLLNPLKQTMEYNPKNTPYEQLQTDCFKRMKLVPETMTVEEFARIDQSDPPWNRLDGDVAGCTGDPINYRGGRPDLKPEELGKQFGFDLEQSGAPKQ